MEAVAGQPYSCPYLALHVQGKLACLRWSRLSGPLLLEHRLAAALGGAGCFVTWQTRHQSPLLSFLQAFGAFQMLPQMTLTARSFCF